MLTVVVDAQEMTKFVGSQHHLVVEIIGVEFDDGEGQALADLEHVGNALDGGVDEGVVRGPGEDITEVIWTAKLSETRLFAERLVQCNENKIKLTMS